MATAHYESLYGTQITAKLSDTMPEVILLRLDGETTPLHISDAQALIEIFQKLIEDNKATNNSSKR